MHTLKTFKERAELLSKKNLCTFVKINLSNNLCCLQKGDEHLITRAKQAAVGPQGSGSTLNQYIVLKRYWKASVFSKSWIAMILWYRLVGCNVVLLQKSKWRTVVRGWQPTPKGILWAKGGNPTITWFKTLNRQGRWKRSKFSWDSKVPSGSDRRLLTGVTL